LSFLFKNFSFWCYRYFNTRIFN